MLDSFLMTTPVSSPLHPQLNLPLLKAYLSRHGYESSVIDSSIRFFHWFLQDSIPQISQQEYEQNPLKILTLYNELEQLLWQKSQAYEGLHVGLRHLNMKYDRTEFDSVLMALEDTRANPFIAFYEELVAQEIAASPAKIVGIAITFQDQIISAFTLARVLRQKRPDVKIVLGGQMITRCQDSLQHHSGLKKFWDFLTLWDGEMPFLDIHRQVIRGEQVQFVNVIDASSESHHIERTSQQLSSAEVPAPDFSDMDFNAYMLPEMLVPFQTTRGCYAKCAFCAIPFGANSYRVRRPEDIIADLVGIQEYTLKHFGRKARYFKFMEDTSSPAVLSKMACEIEKRGLDIRWETFARLEQAFLRDGVMEQLYRGGCRKIHWGLESNDPVILKNMDKKTSMSHTDHLLELSAKAGILNFCFVLVGFPGETRTMRDNVVRYIISNPNIHTLTLATFDLTRGSPMERDYKPNNIYKLEIVPAQGFQVRLPYLVDGKNWKKMIIPEAHRMMVDIVRARPDIGFVTLFPDQIRSLLCDRYGNEWGRIFVERFGQEAVLAMLSDTEMYAKNYGSHDEIDPLALPEPLRREHYRTKEDLAMIARAVGFRRQYEDRRFNQV